MADPKPCENRVFDFYKIPGGSTAELWVEGNDADFACGVIVDTAAGSKQLEHAQVYRPRGGNQAARATLKSPEITVLTLFVGFTKKATVTVELRILVPGGTHSSTPMRCTLSGAKGAEVRRIFFCKTVQG